LFALCAPGARAQDFKQIAPKPVPAPTNTGPAITPPKPEAPGAGDPNQVIIPELKGIVLQGYAPNFIRNPLPHSGIVIESLPFLDQPELKARLAPFLGKPTSFADLQKIQQVIFTWYRDHNHPFVDVTFPEQDVSTGQVQALVTEFQLGQLRVEGNRWFSSESVTSQLHLAPGEPIDASQLQDDLDWLNQNPFRQVSVVAQKSDMVGATDLIMNTDDRLPLRLYAGYENYGTPALGRDYWTLGANWGQVFGTDQQLSYQLTASDNFWSDPGHATLAAHSVTYLAPLPWRDKINVFGSYSESRPLLGPDLGLVGISGQASIRYIMNFPKNTFLGQKWQGLSQDLQFGYDFKSSNNNLSFGGIEVSNVTTEVDQFPITYDASLLTDYGITSLSNTLVLSPGGLTSGNTDLVFQQQASNPRASARYAYDTLNIVQMTRLPYDASWVMRLTGQVATTNLLPSEQLGAGGHDTVRGYNERDANGSAGFLASQELRSPSFSLIGGWLPGGIKDQAQLLVFWDYASVRDAQFTPGNLPSVKLSSLGAGARYTIGSYLDLRLDYGFQQRRLPGASSLGDLLQVAVTVSY
jgi:hemolysin activation/secretion protein